MTLYDELLEETQHHGKLQHVFALGRLAEYSVERVPADAGQTADVGFFHVRLAHSSDLDAETLTKAILAAEKGEFGDVSRERLLEGPSYIELGAWLGDQGRALMLMGLGQLLGLWEIVTPKLLGIEGDEARHMMGSGFIMIAPGPDSPLQA